MYSVMIVDDDFINRTAIKNMIDWGKLNFEVVCEAKNGKIALDRMQEYNVQVIITDMKMPVMDGLELINNLKNKDVLIIALSAFDEYDLVRKAFKLGVEDYLLKPKLNKKSLFDFMSMIKEKLDRKQIEYTAINKNNSLENFLQHREISEVTDDLYAIVLIDITNIMVINKRFPNIHADVISPMKDIICQLPGTSDSCEFSENTIASLIIRYHCHNLDTKTLQRFCMQVKTVVKNYMNIDITLALSNIFQDIRKIEIALQQAQFYLSMRYIYGENELYSENGKLLFKQEEINIEREKYEPLMESFKRLQGEKMILEEDKLLIPAMNNDISIIKKESLKMIYFEALMLNELGDAIWNIFGKCVNFDEKLNGIAQGNDYIIWMHNFNRYLFEYLEDMMNENRCNKMQNIQRYILDNYADETLNLSEIASMVGLNESYLSTKFKKEFGVNFSDYIKKVRISKAKEMMRTTNLKVYEISKAVGYRNVEHFTRVFRIVTGEPPKKYMERFSQN